MTIDQPSRRAGGDVERLLEHRAVACRAEPGGKPVERRTGVGGAAGRGEHIRAIVERHDRDAFAAGGLVNRLARQLECPGEDARRAHAVGPIDRHHPHRRGRCSLDVGPGKRRGEQQQRDDARGEQEQIAKPAAIRALDRRPVQQPNRRERHVRGHVAPQEMQHDGDRDGQGAEQEGWIQERHLGVQGFTGFKSGSRVH